MIDFITNIAAQYPQLWKSLAIGSAAFFLVTPVLAPALIIMMPPDILIRPRRRLAESPPIRRLLYIIWHLVKNLLGLALIIIGLLLLFLPGQGLLTLFAGSLFADIPGKRKLLARLLAAGKIRPAVERLRKRYGREPLVFPDDRTPLDPAANAD